MYSHPCIKCGNKYEDEDPDAYYCSPCNVVRLQIAKQVDAKVKSMPSSKPMSGLKIYDSSPQVRGFMIVKE